MARTFRSRVSVVLLMFIVASVLPILFLEEPSKNKQEEFIAYGVVAFTLAIILVALFTLRYEVSEKVLQIKIGPFNYSKIKLADIEKVSRSYNPFSSPASSLKRLHVKAKSRDWLISPTSEEEFVRLLKSRNPEIQININDKKGGWRFWDWDI